MSYDALRTSRIARLNDTTRRSGRLNATRGVVDRGPEFVAKAVAAVIAFDAFDGNNDPYGEHDFGAFEIDGERLFWKIDYFADASCCYGSEDPSDPQKCFRVLTLMLADEY